MASTIKIKNSSTAGAAPTASDLVQGELAVNVTDKRIYTENASGTVVELGTNPSVPVTFPDGSASAPSLTNDGDTNTGVYFPAADTVGVTTGGTERVRVDSSGNMGIGTSSPTAKADISGGGDGLQMRLQRTADAGFVLSETTGNTNWKVKNSGGGIYFQYSTTAYDSGYSTKVGIDPSGNLLVGTTSRSSTERLKVDNTDTLVAWFQQSTNTSGYNGITVGLGQNGNNTSTSFFRGNTNNVGNWYLYGNGTTSFSSDERLKKNIETTRDGYIDDVMKLRVVKYNWKKDEDGTPKELGLIAQEVEQVFAGLVQDDVNPVSEDDVTVYKQVKQSVLPFILLKAIQELAAASVEQQAIITQLQAQLTTVSTDVAALKAA